MRARRRLGRIFFFSVSLLASLIMPVLLAAQLISYPQNTSAMTHEETIVRTAYSKLRFAIEQSPVHQLAMEATGIPKDADAAATDQRIANAQLSISLGDFIVGKAKEVLTQKVSDLISPAVGERLYVASGWHDYIEYPQKFQWYEPKASWQPAIPTPSDVINLSLRDFLELQWQHKQANTWETYASYSVTVTYQGKTIGPYKALFMFGRNSKDDETIEPEDGTIDATELVAAMHEHLFDDALIHSSLRTVPVVRDWVNAKQQASYCSESQGVCCDLAHLECGPDASLVEKARKGGLQ